MIGEKVSFIFLKAETAYMIFALHGESDTTCSFLIPSIRATQTRRSLVVVAVRARMWTPAGNKLRISPIRAKDLRKVSPLLNTLLL